MRITPNMTANNALYSLQQGRAKLDKLQELTATGTNINRPSDDPAGSRLLLDVGDQLKAGDQYASNITKATTFLQVTNTALQGMADTMQQAKQLAASISNGSSDPTVRQNVVTQLQAMKQTLVDMGNTQVSNQYVFGGANNSTPPFTNTPTGGPPPSYYHGDETALNVGIAQAAQEQINVPGNQVLTGSSTTGNTPYGTTNILDTFDKLIAAVQSNDVNSPTGIVAESQALENGANQVTNALTDVASRTIRLNNMSTLNTNSQNTLQTIASNIQNVDYAKLGVELANQQTAFQASLSATAKVSRMSLLDYLG
jgi:flagellar hook-associated protein 3 FlgL